MAPGEYEVYCAICGGPLVAVKVSNPAYFGRPPPQRDSQLQGMLAFMKMLQQHQLDKEAREAGSEGHVGGDGAQEEPYKVLSDRELLDGMKAAIEKDLDNEEKENHYNGNILDCPDVEWTEHVHCLGFNLEENQNGETRFSHTRAYISGEGGYSQGGRLYGDNLGLTADLNFDVDSEYGCYISADGSYTNPVFPFHRPCMEILQHRIVTHPRKEGEQPYSSTLFGPLAVSAGDLREREDFRDKRHLGHLEVRQEHWSGNDEYGERGEDVDWDFDKDALYRAMMGILGETCLNIDYAMPTPAHGEEWDSKWGEEYLVSRPLPPNEYCDDFTIKAVAKYVEKCIAIDPPPLASGADLMAKVKHDPFGRLPFDVLHHILEILPSSSPTENLDLSNFGRASFHANLGLRDVGHSFWRAHYLHTMPSFFELHLHFPSAGDTSLANMDKRAWDTPLSSQQMRMIYQATQRLTSWPGVQGVKDKWLLGVANRRRVWSAAGQIADAYMGELLKGTSQTHGANDEILEHSDCPFLAEVSKSNRTVTGLDFRTVYWLRDSEERLCRGEDGEHRGFVFSSHWDSEGWLTGLEFQPKAEEQRLFGEKGATIETIELDHGDWLDALVFHIPPNIEDGETAPRGLTICLNSGISEDMGETTSGHWQRPFMSDVGRAITGAIGYVNEGKIHRFGVLQAAWRNPAEGENSGEGAGGQDENDSDPDFDMGDADDDEEDPNSLAMLLWKHPLTDILDRPIWSARDIAVIYSRHEDFATWGLDRHMLPFEAFIWAKNADESRRLESVSMYGMPSAKPGTPCVIKGMQAEYDSESSMVRSIGRCQPEEWPDEKLVARKLQIDGAGGEMISEAAVMTWISKSWPEFVVKLRTSYGREVVFGNPNFSAEESRVEEWEVMRPNPDEVLIGMVVTFLELPQDDEGIPRGLGSLRLLTMKRSKWSEGE